MRPVKPLAATLELLSTAVFLLLLGIVALVITLARHGWAWRTRQSVGDC